MEIWKAVKGFKGKYEVSNLGRIKSFCKLKSHILKPGIASHGYPTVSLGRINTRIVHSLVAEAFIGKCPEGKEILHKDGDRKNPTINNLKYGSRTENNLQILGDGKRKHSISEILKIKNRIKTRGQAAQISRELNISESHISAIRTGVYYKRICG